MPSLELGGVVKFQVGVDEIIKLTRELLKDDWIQNDWKLSETDREMLKEMNDFLDQIESTRRKNPRTAFQGLRRALSRFEESWIGIRDQLADLTLLGEQIAGRA